MQPALDTEQKILNGTWLEIRLSRLLANLQSIKKCAGPGSQIMAVVKANAYGHGILKIAEALAGRVSYLGIASIAEALTLKEHRIETPIFFFGHFFPEEIPPILMDGITLSVSSFDEAREISELSLSLGRKTTIHIKVDTGMGRLGIPYAQAGKQIEQIFRLTGVIPEGIYTHFPTAESDDGFRDRQVQDLSFLLMELEKKGFTFRFRHAANSAGSIKVKTPVFNLVRPGLMLYGMYPDESLREAVGVSPILAFKSRIISLKRFQPGESVGYGRSYQINSPTVIAVLPVGYSQGYPFSSSNRSWVIHHGTRYPIAGRVSMDYLTVDLGAGSNTKVGDEVTLIGEDHGETIRAEELAQWAHTIPYEITTRLPLSLPRFYK